MSKRTTVYEDRRSNIEKHTLACPHCGGRVLDHMTECPHCKGALEPVGYQPMSDKKIKKIRLITYSIGAVLSVVIIVLILVFKK